MLLQCILGISDEDIINDYHASHREEKETGRMHPLFPQVDVGMFRAAPKQVMQDTLSYLRKKYNTISPGYLNSIGFCLLWQQRLIARFNKEIRNSKL
mmetsp:Transcript_28824/g.44278  ORF Transcript_28824/g.44278 Transcript_28824/m.44278 type:complete len:97 (+) Transcript_28824:610-900(+)